MDQGSRIAIKRLAAVEVEPERSHQHELNAGLLRTALGFPEGRTEGDLSVLLYGRDQAAPEVSTGSFTLYDARDAIPGRTEYRLYYEKALMRGARAGDLLVLYREPETRNLRAIIATLDTEVEAELLRLLEVGADVDLNAFSYVDPGTATEAAAIEADAILVQRPGATITPYRAVEHATYSSAIAEGRMPYTAGMAMAGYELASRIVDGVDPDELLMASLDAETELFYAIREHLLRPELQALAAAGLSVTAVLEWAQRQHQSAKSRRGDSLQHHFAKLLELRGIRNSPQCETEGSRRPDFVIPSCHQYHDPAFPSGHLRMVACKSTVRERWAQILAEADRIPDKYLLTLDRRLSGQTISEMVGRHLYPFVPEAIRLDVYAGSEELGRIGNVAALMDELEAVL